MNKEFDGRSTHTIDTKGRVFIPQTFRDILGENFVISLADNLKTPAFFTSEAWEERSRRYGRISKTDRKAHMITLMLHGNTFKDYNCDNQGRVLIPQALREYFKFKEGEDVTLVGSGDSLELWSIAAYNAQMEQLFSTEEIPDNNVDKLLDYIEDKYYAPNAEQA